MQRSEVRKNLNSRLERAESRGQRSEVTQACGAKRSLKHTGARPVDGAGRGGGEGTEGGGQGFFLEPETWNLKPK